MKLSSVFKVFGAAALIAGLTPYRVTKDEETGEKKYRALFWEAASGPRDEGMEKGLTFHVGFFSPTVKDEEEPHFFADELTVEYTTQSESDADSSAEAEEESEEAEEEVSEEDETAEEAEEAEETVETVVENVEDEAAEPEADVKEDTETSQED